jgi:IclR family pca regulon transcriptional regulator
MDKTTDGRHRRNYLKTLDRGLRVLAAFTPEQPALSLTELARRVEFDPGTAFRFAYTLEHLGYLRRDAGGAYHLTARVLQLGQAVQQSGELRSLALPHMERLAHAVEETVSLAVRDGGEIVVIEQVESPRPVTVRRRLGDRQPAHATAQGKVLLAYMPATEQRRLLDEMVLTAYSPRTITERPALEAELRRTLQRGYAVNNNEMDAGLRALAVPICQPPGQVVAALSIDMPVGRMSMAQMQASFIDALIAAGSAISADLGYGPGDAAGGQRR